MRRHERIGRRERRKRFLRESLEGILPVHAGPLARHA
jgi:hypothetical protein